MSTLAQTFEMQVISWINEHEGLFDDIADELLGAGVYHTDSLQHPVVLKLCEIARNELGNPKALDKIEEVNMNVAASIANRIHDQQWVRKDYKRNHLAYQ